MHLGPRRVHLMKKWEIENLCILGTRCCPLYNIAVSQNSPLNLLRCIKSLLYTLWRPVFEIAASHRKHFERIPSPSKRLSGKKWTYHIPSRSMLKVSRLDIFFKLPLYCTYRGKLNFEVEYLGEFETEFEKDCTWIRDPDGFVWWKKPELENLVLLSL